MEEALKGVTTEHGLSGLLAGVIIVLCLHLVMKVRDHDGKKLDHLTKSMEENTKALTVLNSEFKHFNQRVIDADQFGIKTEMGLSRLNDIVRALAGEKKWEQLLKKIKEANNA